jgi:hypothetical protein
MQSQHKAVREAPAALGSAAVKVLMMYEDLGSGNRVMRMFDSLLHHCGSEIPFHSDMWKFDTLRCASIARLAAQDACDADVVIISAHGSEDLPEELKAWFHLWIGRRSHHRAALVALLDHAAGLVPELDPTQCYLQGLARQGCMDFIPMSVDEEETDLPIRHAISEADEPPPVLEAFCREIVHAPPASSPLRAAACSC